MTYLLDALAVYRLWRLAAEDAILDRPRNALISAAWARAGRTRRAVPGEDPPPMVVQLLRCPWCLGLWISLAVAAGGRTRPWRIARTPLALSAAAGIIAETIDRLER